MIPQAMWDERFSSPDYVYGKEPNDFVKEYAPSIQGDKVLCLGEGEGRNAVYLAECGFDVTAVDLSPVALKKAARLAEERGVTLNLEQVDLATHIIEPSGWDAIIAVFCHLPEQTRRRVHHQVQGGLKEGGRVYMEAYAKSQLRHNTGGPRDIGLLYNCTMLQQDFSSLSVVRNQLLTRQIHEGQLHNGPSDVIQFIAER